MREALRLGACDRYLLVVVQGVQGASPKKTCIDTQVLRPGAGYVVILRHPVERVVSLYRYIRTSSCRVLFGPPAKCDCDAVRPPSGQPVETYVDAPRARVLYYPPSAAATTASAVVPRPPSQLRALPSEPPPARARVEHDARRVRDVGGGGDVELRHSRAVLAARLERPGLERCDLGRVRDDTRRRLAVTSHCGQCLKAKACQGVPRSLLFLTAQPTSATKGARRIRRLRSSARRRIWSTTSPSLACKSSARLVSSGLLSFRISHGTVTVLGQLPSPLCYS